MTVRDPLRSPGIAATTHAGLWLDRYLPHFSKASETVRDGAREHIRLLLKQARAPEIYRSHYQRWTTHIAGLCAQDAARMAQAQVNGRMIVGLGTESILEVGISLHRTYGVPMIPGSALKGLAARYARRLVDPAWHGAKRSTTESPDTTDGSRDTSEGRSHRALFGDHAEAGCVVFHDALWVPHEVPGLPLELDVMTVHHADYYRGGPKDSTPPADSDNPNPIPFVTAQGRYLIALEGPPAWTDAAMALLKIALSSEGIGAKTAAGYGRLTLDYTSAELAAAAREEQAAQDAAVEEEQAAKAAAEQARKADAAEVDRLRRIKELLRDLEVHNASAILPKLLDLAGEAARHAIALQCVEKLESKKVRAAIKDQKPWVQPLVAILYPDDKGPSR